MTRQTLALTDALHAYVVANGSEPDDLVRDLIAETARGAAGQRAACRSRRSRRRC